VRLRAEAGRQISRSEILVLTLILEHMPAKAKKILVTTESHEVFVIRRDRRYAVRGFCPVCCTEVELFYPDEEVRRQDPGEPDSIEQIEELAMIDHRES
jgi:hypothetical protein